ncbi:hypothetical protein MMC11_005015 [Xylographa trunciseda]|nr:hypothetical protein [Xylographa trunciseda]
MVGHIEDIAVAKDQQGKRLGLHIIQALDYLAEKVGCYKNPKQHRASGAKRLSGRPSYKTSTSSLNSQNSFTLSAEPERITPEETSRFHEPHHHHHHHEHGSTSPLISQILGWLHDEKRKRSRRAVSRNSREDHGRPATKFQPPGQEGQSQDDEERSRRTSESSDGGLALEKLERILAENMVIDPGMLKTPTREHRGFHLLRRSSSIRKLGKSVGLGSSDTEYYEGDVVVPSTEVTLDNSKTLSYAGGAVDSEKGQSGNSKRTAKEKEAWLTFKSEIVRLTHTLRLKGWRRVALDRGGDIKVERLSGALTNAVYVVSPPSNLPQTNVDGTKSATAASKKVPLKLLLRIYGPQVEHLIDRESELQILRRLARKKIGPRLLGTFTNGRFEEFFHARTLTASDLRVPETSMNIAKRMRELHDGIELLEEERDNGPFIWRNWDKWVTRCEEVITWVDHQIISGEAGPARGRADEWKRRGLVCGVEWSVFRKTVERYRGWLNDQYGGPAGLRQHLVFAHNDVNRPVATEVEHTDNQQTQYGNLLRLEPSGESPLLLPMNEHKQLVVIDFEYASANTRGLEFANHFTEWCYNYHDPDKAFACNTTAYPTPAEQYRFLKAYVQHRPQYTPHASATPLASPSPGPASSISAFMLDSRSPPASSYAEEERLRQEETEKEIRRLTRETRLWRIANSAQWVAWGVVQAKIDGMEQAEKTPTQSPPARHTADPLSPAQPPAEKLAPLDKRPEGLVAEALAQGRDPPRDDADDDEEEAFDYLGYAQERAMFFWGDCLGMGFVREEELPGELVAKVKRVEY